MAKILNHNSWSYRQKAPMAHQLRNGAFFYSKEICDYFIPSIKTERPWITVNDNATCWDGSIVFVHNNLYPEHYEWLSEYEDLILVCGIPETCEKVAHLGKTIYLPISIDVAFVERFKRDEKHFDVAFAGRKEKADGYEFEEGTQFICGLDREMMLRRMSDFKRIYAVGRCALEAKVLGCEILPYDSRFPDVDRWKVLDSKEAAKILQEKLDEIDGR